MPAVAMRDLPSPPPQGRIVASTTPARQPGLRGVRAMSTLDCGHELVTLSGDRQRGWCFSFHCRDEGHGPGGREPPG